MRTTDKGLPLVTIMDEKPMTTLQIRIDLMKKNKESIELKFLDEPNLSNISRFRPNQYRRRTFSKISLVLRMFSVEGSARTPASLFSAFNGS